jgi:hypothetical protein
MKLLLVVLVSAGRSTFWSRNYAFHSMPRELTHPDTEAQPAWRSGSLSPEATAILENRSKGPERTFADNWSFSEESGSRVNEIVRKYALSHEDQEGSYESNRRTTESMELARKSGYRPRN